MRHDILDLDTDLTSQEGQREKPRRGHAVLAYDVSSWERFLFDARAPIDGSSVLNQAEWELEKALLPPKKDGEDMVDVCDRHDPDQVQLNLAETFTSEAFARLYGDPALLPEEERDERAPWATRAHEILSALPEFEELRAAVEGDPDMAAFAAATLVQSAAGAIGQIAQEERERQEAEDRGEPAPPKPPGPSAEDHARAAMRGACRKAAAESQQRRSDLEGLCAGLGSAPPSHEQESPTRMALADRIAGDTRLREVLRRAGQMTRIANTKRQERRSVDARSEVVDLERGADLGRVLPAEIAGLRHPRLRLLKLRGIAERSLLQYRLEGTEPMGRGPIVVLLDRSGSMDGDPHTWARAVGIACLGMGRREKRAVTVIDFDSRVVQAVHVAKDGRACIIAGRRTEPLASYTDAVFRVAGINAGGGTDFEPALRTALDGLPAGIRDARSDLVFVTDGEADFPESYRKEIETAKKGGLRIYGATVNGGKASKAVRELCDVVTDLDRPAVKGDRAGAAAAVLPGA